MNLENFDAFILDLDGTLLDSGKYHARAYADTVLELSGYTLTPDEHHEFFAAHSTSFSKVLSERRGLSLDPEQVLARKRERMKEIFVAKLFPGARDFLKRWHGKKPLVLATNSPRAFVLPALEAVGLGGFFESILTADDVENRKPDPEIFEKAIQKLGVAPRKTLAFEDQLIGIQAARAAGASVVAVDNGQPVVFPPNIPVFTWEGLLAYVDPAKVN